MLQHNKLLYWYQEHSYQFPWRLNKNPYNIWISEIMLQQTQVKTVIPYYIDWMENYPDIESLQNASIDQLLLLWQGLGYYKRVHSIYSSSKIISSDYNKVIPNNYYDLIHLPGIGDYTASMILSIAFNNNHYIPVDGNIKRIMSRLHTIPQTKQTLKNYKYYTKQYIHPTSPGDSIQALMDLGRSTCVPKKPKCEICPISNFCQAYKTNKTNLF